MYMYMYMYDKWRFPKSWGYPKLSQVRWMVCSGKSYRQWMMTGATPMTKRKPPNGAGTNLPLH